MALRLGDVPALLRTPIGRRRLLIPALTRGWPLLAPPAALYRRTLARRTRIIAVTGSFGKTTTARAIMAALGQPGTSVNRNFKGFLALALLRIRPGRRHAVIEIGISHADEMVQYARVVHPDVAVVTSVGSEHHRALGGLEAIRAEKSHIVRALGAAGTAVLNGDDPNVRWMREHTRARVTTFGFDETSDVRASDPVLDWPRGTRFRLRTREGVREVRPRLLGRPGVYAVLAAVAVALTEGVALDRAIAALEELEPTPGRLQPITLASGAILLRDDFKAPEETIMAALDVLAEVPAARRLVVLGEVGEPVGRRKDVYRRIGERVAQVASGAIFIAEHGRFRDYRAGAGRAGFRPDAVLHAGQRAGAAVEALRDDLGPGDVVLIKGRVSQRLARVALALMGRDVRCELTSCEAEISCDRCPMLERGW